MDQRDESEGGVPWANISPLPSAYSRTYRISRSPLDKPKSRPKAHHIAKRLIDLNQTLMRVTQLDRHHGRSLEEFKNAWVDPSQGIPIGYNLKGSAANFRS